MTREQLNAVYLDWVNNFISVTKFAEYYGLHNHEAVALIELARAVHNRNHPDE
jgi:hypothetical protein